VWVPPPHIAFQAERDAEFAAMRAVEACARDPAGRETPTEAVVRETQEQQWLAQGWRRVRRQAGGSDAGAPSLPPAIPEPISESQPSQPTPHKRPRGRRKGDRLNTPDDYEETLRTVTLRERRVPTQREIGQALPHPVEPDAVGDYFNHDYDGGWGAAQQHCKEILGTAPPRTSRPRD
jgi:hypothetical protein